ncbi:gamma-butyrobetaine hydroxylase-like domain-containing protein [Marinibactrum halimedae]|uniref:1-(5-phosphoribosyl)-5-[(5-phosphoribosylamino) methylideneamino] imidazole-4-carboxamide isomerase n=1 Tax=Marinibactrum halimedae TaxID=1444977 RepID=A0AA37T1T2_9GAMM|nr:gamma-butyrobetaine hydroxylase-like domain-containing protein [Marinibactrum halimedae]GLS24489.1 1-(5-phosphoribosyl)-5-[(5-phosphoribosylamino) methylideneamino] imidazole-4-carboxamide isomerase [Marinibactrum halimedae]
MELIYESNEASFTYTLTAEFLRVHSPSADVRGHGNEDSVLQAGKKGVEITHIAMSGHYGINIHFNDNHHTGIYTWSYLKDLCTHQQSLWETYLEKLHEAGLTREANTQVIRFPK